MVVTFPDAVGIFVFAVVSLPFAFAGLRVFFGFVWLWLSRAQFVVIRLVL